MGPTPRVTVCLTTFEAESEFADLLSDLDGQHGAPAFLVSVVEAGVAPTSRALVAGRDDVLYEECPGNISTGRNLAIRRAPTDVVATVDAGVRLPRTWLRDLAGPVIDGDATFAATAFAPRARSRWGALIAAYTIPLPAEFARGSVLPSARSTAFLKRDWEELGGYPEDLDHSEDLVFYKRLTALRGTPHWVLSPPVSWNSRESLPAFFRQYRLYARGDGMARLYAKRHAARYAFYLGWTALVLVQPLSAAALPVSWWFVVRRGLGRLGSHEGTRGLSLATRVLAGSCVQLVGDAGKMVGYAQGRLARRHRTG